MADMHRMARRFADPHAKHISVITGILSTCDPWRDEP